jgi:hypothetical protein
MYGGASPGGPRRFKKKALQKLYQTQRIKIHPNLSVLKLPLLLDLQQKVCELVLSITSCPSIIILENTLNLVVVTLTVGIMFLLFTSMQF